MTKKNPWIIGLIVATVFSCLYFWQGTSMGATGALTERSDLMYSSDLPRVVEDLAIFRAKHWRTYPHPLFVLLLNPPGVALTKLTGSPITAAVGITAVAGGICVFLEWILLLQIGLPFITALLLTCILGMSAAHLFFGSMPETYIFSAIALLLLAICTLRVPGDIKWFLPSGILALGFLVTNFFQAILIFFCSMIHKAAWKSRLIKTAKYGLLVLFVTGSINIMQKVIYPQTGIFFRPRAVTQEERFTYIPNGSDEITSRALSLAAHLLVFDFVDPRPNITFHSDAPPSVTFDQNNIHLWTPIGLAAAVLMLLIWAFASWILIAAKPPHQPLIWAAITCIAFNLVLHSVYGDQLFLYTCNWTWAFVVLIAYASKEYIRRGWSIITNLTLLILLVLLIANNLTFIHNLVILYRHGTTS